MGEVREISFSVDGHFITQLAREELCKGNFDHAMDLLMSCMEGTDLPKCRIREMAFSILDGYAEISGTYPGDDYGYTYLDEKDQNWDIGGVIKKLYEENERLKEELNQMTGRYNTAMEHVPDYKIDDVLVATGQKDPALPMSPMLHSFLQRAADEENHSTEDYGWLEPSGKFHEVDWCNHQEWAEKYIRENMTEEEWLTAGIHMPDQVQTAVYNTFGDYLISRGWVLLHNPYQGTAIPTRDESRTYTKAQKEFLYDYYIERGCISQANEIYEEE